MNGNTENDPLDQLERYSMGESAFFECLTLDRAGRGGDQLPPALTPNIGLKFPVFDAKIEAKYGVRNYIRMISEFYSEIDKGFGRILPTMLRGHVPLKSAISIVKMYSDAHIYDLWVRQIKKAGKSQFYVRSLEPRAGLTRVARLQGDDAKRIPGYEEEIVMLVQREVMLGEKRDEIMWALQPVAFTYHAMIRLWERGAGDGQTFHLMMAEAFRRLRGVSALVELSCLLTKGTLPHHIAIPILDGFMVASRRNTVVKSDEGRWGVRRNGWRGQVLDLEEDEYFIWEYVLETEGGHFTTCDRWFAATYMGANDLSGWERSLAAQKFTEMLRSVDLDHVARVREWVARPSSKRPDRRFTFELPDLRKVMDLQQEMLPRQDPADDRVHLIDF